MISYCIATYRPAYSRRLIADLARKTSAPYEILVWLNVDDPELEAWLTDQSAADTPVRVVGRTPENIGMQAYQALFAASQGELVTQIDDDVVMVSPNIAERAAAIFQRFPSVRQITADVWQDEFTTGARPPMQHYRAVDRRWGLWDGPIDGWFSVYHRSILPLVPRPEGRYFGLGGLVQAVLRQRGLRGVLCQGFRVFHVIGPQYAYYFGMLDFEIAKYRSLGRHDIVAWYEDECARLPPLAVLERNVGRIEAALARPAGGVT